MYILYILAPKMYILAPKIYIVDILVPKMYIWPKMDKSLPFEKVQA